MKFKWGLKEFKNEYYFGISIIVITNKGIAYTIELDNENNPRIINEQKFDKNIEFRLALFKYMLWIKLEEKRN